MRPEAQDNATRLRDVVKAIRACKTTAEEHSVVSEECAKIRSSFRVELSENRHRNVAKLIFFHMLGYPTSFGYIECLKLIVSRRMSEKKIGYLALCELMGEENELTLMSVSSIKADLGSDRPAVVQTALSAIANVGSPDMCRELAPDILNLLKKSKLSIMPRAALAACRVVTKCPELLDDFLPIATTFVDERHTQLLGAGLSLIITILKLDPGKTAHFAHFCAAFQIALRELVMRDSTEELDINNIIDPFTQCRLLEVLRMVGREVRQEKADLEETLAYVLTSTDYGKQTGRSVIYQCCLTILDLPSSLALRDQALSMLGRLLLSRENNTRFISLKGMGKESGRPGALQSFMRSVMECIQDPDWAVARRALDLMTEMTNRDNVRQVISDLLSLLITADPEVKDSIAHKISMLAELHSLDQRDYIDTTVRVLSLSSSIDEDTVNRAANIILNSPQLHQYAVKMLFWAAKENSGQEGLVQLAVWCIGEYADLLVMESPDIEVETPTSAQVHDFLRFILTKDSVNVRLYAVVAVAKACVRLPTEEAEWRFLISDQKHSPYLEVQQRACEYCLCLDLPELKESVFRSQPIFQTDRLPSLSPHKSPENHKSPSLWEPASLPTTAPTWSADLLTMQETPQDVNLMENLPQIPTNSVDFSAFEEKKPIKIQENLLDLPVEEEKVGLGDVIFGEVSNSQIDEFSELPSILVYSDTRISLHYRAWSDRSGFEVSVRAIEAPIEGVQLVAGEVEAVESWSGGIASQGGEMKGSWRVKSQGNNLERPFTLQYLFQGELMRAEGSFPGLFTDS